MAQVRTIVTIIDMDDVQNYITAVSESNLPDHVKEYLRKQLDAMQDELYTNRFLTVVKPQF